MDNSEQLEKNNQSLFKGILKIALIIFVILLSVLIGFFLPHLINIKNQRAKSYSASFETTLVTDTTSIGADEKHSVIYEQDIKDEKDNTLYKVSTTVFAYNSNADISPLPAKYLYHAYGRAQNDLGMEFVIQNSDDEDVTAKISNLKLDIYLGEDEISLLEESQYQIENNLFTYRDTSDIYLNHFKVSFSI